MGRISALTELTSLASDDYLVVLDSSANIAKKITVANAFGIPDLGFTAAGESWAYASASTITVPTDATTKYAKGMTIKITQSTGGTKYGTIIGVSSTLLTIAWRNGATLANEAITSPSYAVGHSPVGASQIEPSAIRNPYKFSAYCSSGKSIANTTLIVDLQTELFDTNSNFASSRYTAPIAGYFQINARAWFGSAGSDSTEYCELQLRKNGTTVFTSGRENGSGNANRLMRPTISTIVELAAGDYLEIFMLVVGSRDIVSGQTTTYMNGFMVSQA